MSALLSCTLFYQLRTAFVLQHLCFLSAFLFVHKMNVERTGRPSSLVQVQLDSIRQFGRIKHCRPVHLGKENFKTSSVLALLVSTETLMMVTHDSILPLTPPPPHLPPRIPLPRDLHLFLLVDKFPTTPGAQKETITHPQVDLSRVSVSSWAKLLASRHLYL